MCVRDGKVGLIERIRFNDVESKVVKKIALWITQPAGKV